MQVGPIQQILQFQNFSLNARCVKIFEAQTSLNHLVSDQFAENNAKLNRYWETLHPKGLRIGNSKTFDAFFFAGQILPTWPCSSLSASAGYQWAVQCPECVTRLSRFPVDAQFPSP